MCQRYDCIQRGCAVVRRAPHALRRELQTLAGQAFVPAGVSVALPMAATAYVGDASTQGCSLFETAASPADQ
eukprot:4934624-Lingulodinium_polyedra.AAC.1